MIKEVERNWRYKKIRLSLCLAYRWVSKIYFWRKDLDVEIKLMCIEIIRVIGTVMSIIKYERTKRKYFILPIIIVTSIKGTVLIDALKYVTSVAFLPF